MSGGLGAMIDHPQIYLGKSESKNSSFPFFNWEREVEELYLV
jgi:hypothetical protein